MSKAELYLNALQNAGYRLTAQRRMICDYLATTEQHPTPYQVYADLLVQHPTMNRATVYNTLNTLRELGAILQLDLGDEHTHYETNPAPHINLVCRRCHAIVDHAFEPPPAILSAVHDHAAGFAAETLQIQVLGLCLACQKEMTR